MDLEALREPVCSPTARSRGDSVNWTEVHDVPQRSQAATRGTRGGGTSSRGQPQAPEAQSDLTRDVAATPVGRRMRVALLSTYPPRACGIGSFAADVRKALVGAGDVASVEIVAVVDEPSSPQAGDILATVSQFIRSDYTRAARLLSLLDIDVVLVQHEYGIFGGPAGEYVLSFVNALTQPLVVTLHTVVSEPSAQERKVLSELCRQAEIVTVMTETAKALLVDSRIVDEAKIRVVPHGAPAVIGAATDRRPSRHRAGSFQLATFGLLSSGKGIETMLDAMPRLLERHPGARYLVAGRTHPQVARKEGERYRLYLEQRALDLGIEEHVVFDDRFLEIHDLAALLAATDVFVTPYRNREQISSGALTFALAAGCAVVSTPYVYATDVLASGAGRLIPFGDSRALADAVSHLFDHPDALTTARREAARIGASLAWPSVARTTATALREAVRGASRRPPMLVIDAIPRDVRVDHLRTLVDDVGIVQHADGAIPNRSSGYCVDDVARLVPVAAELARRDIDGNWTTVVHRSIGFLRDAADGAGMRNFMGYDRRWLDEPHHGDHVGRTIWALGEVLATAWTPALVRPAGDLLTRLVRCFPAAPSLRTSAYAILGLALLDPDRLGLVARNLLTRLLESLAEAYDRHASPEWRWLEDRLTYDNARLPQALIVGGGAVGSEGCIRRGLDSLTWLGAECGLPDGVLRLPGHTGRERGSSRPGDGDEQPLDACAFVEAELAAWHVTGAPEHGVHAQRSFAWFTGRNRLEKPIYDFATGGCGDGLGEHEVNGNQGAESTLAFHRAYLSLDQAGLPSVLRGRRQVPELAA